MPQQLDIQGRTKEEEAIEFMRQHEPPEGYFLGFSGGKDSTVLKHLAELSGVKFKAYYSATGIDPPEVVHFIKRHHPDVTFCRPKKSFYKLVVEKGFPTKFKRWCCDEIKKKNTRHIPLTHRLLGMRAEESHKRAMRDRIDRYGKSKKSIQVIYKPIFMWNEADVWEYIDRHALPYCYLYDEGFDRIGCVVCPFLCDKSGKKIELHKKRWPKIYAAFERSMEELYETRAWYKSKVQGRSMLFEEFLENWYKGR